MPLQNRVDPFSSLQSVSSRGLFTGNRGVLHNAQQEIVNPRWQTKLWIICTLDVRPGRQPRRLMSPNRWTELFFLDEATAMAAGHRPCAECRYAAWKAYGQALRLIEDRPEAPKAPEINQRLHGEMRTYLNKFKPQPRPLVAVTALPDGAFFTRGEKAYLKWQGAARHWTFEGYGAPEPLPEQAQRLTPELNCLALQGGYRPALHESV